MEYDLVEQRSSVECTGNNESILFLPLQCVMSRSIALVYSDIQSGVVCYCPWWRQKLKGLYNLSSTSHDQLTYKVYRLFNRINMTTNSSLYIILGCQCSADIWWRIRFGQQDILLAIALPVSLNKKNIKIYCCLPHGDNPDPTTIRDILIKSNLKINFFLHIEPVLIANSGLFAENTPWINLLLYHKLSARVVVFWQVGNSYLQAGASQAQQMVHRVHHQQRGVHQRIRRGLPESWIHPHAPGYTMQAERTTLNRIKKSKGWATSMLSLRCTNC